MSDRLRIKIPRGVAVDLVIEMDDGSVRVLEAAKVASVDMRSASPDVRFDGRRWSEERSEDTKESARRVEEERKAQKRAEQSARDREPWTWRVDYKSTPFDFKDIDPPGASWFDEYTRTIEDMFRRTARRASQQPPRPPPPRITGWRTALGFGEHERPSISEVKRRHRQRMAAAHPDAGGSHEKAVALNRAMDEAKRELRQVSP